MLHRHCCNNGLCDCVGAIYDQLYFVAKKENEMFGKPAFEQAIRELEEELKREPTTEETNERMADIEAKAIDDVYENTR